MEIDTPYLIIGYGQAATIAIITFAVILPSLLVLNKLCSGIRIWQGMIQGFFWNSPLRAITETYIEVCVVCFLNLLNIKWGNASQVVATITAFIVGVYVILVPFIMLNIIWSNRPNLKHAKFK